MANLVKEAGELYDWMRVGGHRPEDFTIAMGVDKLHVWTRREANQWSGELPTVWKGIPVEWNFGSGDTVAHGTAH